MIIKDIKADLPVVDEPLAFELAHRRQIDAYWNQRLEANPRLWNGPFFLFTDAHMDGQTLRARGHRTDFATFLYVRHVDRGRDFNVMHITGTSLPVTSDNAIVAMEMASHTANAGHIYYPAGSFDPQDLVDGHLDPMTNVRREMAEEIGMKLDVDDFQRQWVGVMSDDTWHVALPVHLPMTFAECERHFVNYQAESGDDELARIVPVRSKADAKPLRPFARLLAEHMLDAMKATT